MAVSGSSIVSDLRTAITQLVDDIDSLHVGVSHSSLSTVMGLSKEGAVPSVADRATPLRMTHNIRGAHGGR